MDIQPSADALKMTCLVTESQADPILIYDDAAALVMAVVDRGVAHLLPKEWDAPGVYVLLDPIGTDGSWGCYVGQAVQPGLRTRIQKHLKEKDHWSRALLIARDTTLGWNSAQIGWLEGRLYDFVRIIDAARPSNGNRPSDNTLPPFERTALEECVTAAAGVLRMLGFDTSVPGEEPMSVARRAKSSYSGTLKDLVDAGLLNDGTQLVSLMPTWPATATVNVDGTMTVNGKTFDKPSPAANFVGASANGWRFWGFEDLNGRSPLALLRLNLNATAERNAR
jgi:hypothetical protein